MTNRRRAARVAWAIVLTLLLAGESVAAGRVGVLALDGLSFLAFEGAEELPIPAGSSITFRFAPEAIGGSLAFTIEPHGVSISSIPLSGGRGELQYRLAAPATGTINDGEDGFAMSFTAKVSVTRTDGSSATATTYTLRFTTQNATATGTKTGTTVSVDGMKVVPTARYVQLVGATPNNERAFPHPGRAVYMVLSGSFDWLPSLD